MNANYLRGLEIDELVRLLEERYERDDLREAAEIAQEKLRTIEDFWPFAGFLFERREIDPAAWEKVMKDGAADNLAEARAALAELPNWDKEAIEAALRGVVEQRGVKPKEVFQPVRVAISGTTVSPGIFESLAVLGREETLAADRCCTGFGQKNGFIEPKSNWDSTICRVRADRAAHGTLRRPHQGQVKGRPKAAAKAPAKRSNGRIASSSSRRHNEGHGRRLTAAFEALEAFPALAESRNRLLTTVREDGSVGSDVVEVVESDVALIDRSAADREPRSLAQARQDRRRSPRRSRSSPRAASRRSPHAPPPSTSSSAPRSGTSLPERFRLHAVATQRAAERIAREIGFEQRDELLVSALLHDIGKLVLVHAYPGYPGHIHGDARTPEERVAPRAARARRRPRRGRRRARSPLGTPRTGSPRRSSAITPRTAARRPRSCASATCSPTTRQGHPVDPNEMVKVGKSIGLSPEKLRGVMYELPYAGSGSPRQIEPCPLSAREIEVLKRLAEGKVYKQIALELEPLDEHGAHAPPQHVRQARCGRPRPGRACRHRARLALAPAALRLRPRGSRSRRSPSVASARPHCGMVATVEDGRITKLRPDPDHPLSKGYACPKGIAMPDVQNDPDRVVHPLRRAPTASSSASAGTRRSTTSATAWGGHRRAHGKKSVGWYMGNPAAFSLLAPALEQGLRRRPRLAALLHGRLAGREQPLRRERAAVRHARWSSRSPTSSAPTSCSWSGRTRWSRTARC